MREKNLDNLLSALKQIHMMVTPVEAQLIGRAVFAIEDLRDALEEKRNEDTVNRAALIESLQEHEKDMTRMPKGLVVAAIIDDIRKFQKEEEKE